MMRLFKALTVVGISTFIAFHSQQFLRLLEPNVVFAWLAAILIECVIIILALESTKLSKLLLILVVCISVGAATGSFLSSHGDLLEKLLVKRAAVELLERDVMLTQQEGALKEKYLTKSIRRSRALRDELYKWITQSEGTYTVGYKLGAFFLLIFILQISNVYIASSLKSGKLVGPKEVALSSLAMKARASKPIVQRVLSALQKDKVLSPRDFTFK